MAEMETVVINSKIHICSLAIAEMETVVFNSKNSHCFMKYRVSVNQLDRCIGTYSFTDFHLTGLDCKTDWHNVNMDIHLYIF